jgi:hypothetical protein
MMQPFTFLPWAWREPLDLDPEPHDEPSAEADEAASEGIAGYHVEAADGRIGTVDEATYETGSASIVVDTGPWIFGHKALLPAGTVQRVDHAERVVYVDRTKEQIKNAPEYDKDSPEYREQVGTYYSDSYQN